MPTRHTDVPHDAQLHHTVIERLTMERVRNFTSYGPYRPAPLRNHRDAKPFFQNIAGVGSDL
jgi:hypothetical protein